MACRGIEMVCHTSALEIIYRAVLHVCRVVRYAVNACGFSIKTDVEFLSPCRLRTSDIGPIDGNHGGGILRCYLVELSVFLQDIGVGCSCRGVVHAIHRACEVVTLLSGGL